MTRYIIIGAGAIGGGIGGRLTQAGRSAVLVARGEHLAALQAHGIRLRSPEADVTIDVDAIGGPDEIKLHEDDVLVLATKTQQAPAALAQWADAPVPTAAGDISTAGSRLPILTALNGVASEGMAMRYFARVFGVCVWMPAVHLEPGEVIIRSAPGTGVFHVGRVPMAAATEQDRSLLAQLDADWTAAGLAVTGAPDVMRWKYRKLISNIANALQALVGNNGDIAALVQAAEQEARSVLTEAGIAYTDDAEEHDARARSSSIALVPGAPADLGGSTWQSLTRGTGNVESDYLNGEIVQIAHRGGFDAPINARVATLARNAASRGDKPGSLTVVELTNALGLAGG